MCVCARARAPHFKSRTLSEVCREKFAEEEISGRKWQETGKIALKSSVFIVHKYYYTDEIKYNEIDLVCNTHGRRDCQ